MATRLPAPAWAVLGTLALVKLGLHLATSEGYGHFRDELYYLASTEHMAWGYVEHPPLSIALLWLSRALLGDSLLAVRFLPAVAGSATVLVAGLFARELGGGARAQGLAALCVLTTPFHLAIAHFYSMNAFDVLTWAALGWIAARALLREQPRLWLLFGAVAGIGLLNKISVGFLGFGLAVGLVLTSQRRWLASPWLWLGGATAFVLFAPHLAWQIEQGWPTLEFQANARAEKNVALSAFEFAAQQILMGNPVLLPVWATGLWALLAGPGFAALRPLGIVYPVLFVLFVATNAKVYYLAPIYTMLFAVGAATAEPFLARRPWRTPVAAALIVAFSLPAVPITLPLLSQEDLVTYSRALGMEPPATEKHEQGALPQSFADMHGWEDLVDAVARVAAELPPEERAGSIVLATNYGEAGALEVLGAGRELPPVVCGHNSYWEWRPATIDGTVIALRRSREELLRWFDSVERVDTVRCQWCMPYQNEAPVHLARGLRVPPEQLWLEIKRFQ